MGYESKSGSNDQLKNEPPSSSDFWLPWMTGVGIGFLLIFGAALTCWCLRHRLARKFAREGLKFRPNSSNNSSGALILQGQYHAIMSTTNSSTGPHDPSLKSGPLVLNCNSAVVQMSSLVKISQEKNITEEVSLCKEATVDSKIPDDHILEVPSHSEFIGSQNNTSPVKLIPLTTPKFRNNSTRSASSKGLLKSRRGSRTSLTISLSPSMDSLHSKSALGSDMVLLDSQQNLDNHYSASPLLNSKVISRRDSRSVLEHLIPTGHRLTLAEIREEVNDNSGEFFKEFWSIPMNHASKKDIGLAGIGNKNRYQTILPNESTRVTLSEINGDPLSTYINANYIRGYGDKKNVFIATQGPMSHTIDDFWRMVWETKCPAIVMITNLIEKKKRKCEDYLPSNENKSQIYGCISVAVDCIEERDGFTVRKLKLKIVSDDHTNPEERQCLHFWFTSWPDHTTPNSPSQLLYLVESTRAYTYWPSAGGTGQRPVIVHCSAGLGRTGCFICLSIACDMLRTEQSVDLLAILCSVRLDRGGLVQSGEQYEFLYKTLACLEDCDSPYTINESYESAVFTKDDS